MENELNTVVGLVEDLLSRLQDDREKCDSLQTTADRVLDGEKAKVSYLRNNAAGFEADLADLEASMKRPELLLEPISEYDASSPASMMRRNIELKDRLQRLEIYEEQVMAVEKRAELKLAEICQRLRQRAVFDANMTAAHQETKLEEQAVQQELQERYFQMLDFFRSVLQPRLKETLEQISGQETIVKEINAQAAHATSALTHLERWPATNGNTRD